MLNSVKIIPNPKVFKLIDGYFYFPKKTTVTFRNCCKDQNVLRLLKQIIPTFEVVEEPSIITFYKSDLKEETYEINVSSTSIDIFASSPKGWFYALQSLRQIIKNERIPCCYIQDYPDLSVRGVMLDISRSKVPKVETLKNVFDLLAFLKYNHVELYVEGFSFEYKSFKEVLKDGNYLTLDEYLELEKYAFDNFLEFVPNQNGFGHMTDWLEIPEYARFAECPDGFEIWGSWKKPSTFNPLDEDAIKHVEKMYGDMLPHTKSKYFNMNFDEPFELGHGKSKEAVLASSVEDVFIDYLHKLAKVVRSYGKTPLIWGDVVIKHPDAFDKIDEDIILIDWGYSKGYDFESHAKVLNEKNRKYILAGGTSTWGVITSRYEDMYKSISNSASAAKSHNGLGIIVTDWGDIGHLQYLPNSYIGFIHGAISSWSSENEEDVIYMLEQIVGKDIADILLKLSRYTELEGPYRDYGSRLFYHILWSEHAQKYKDPMSFFNQKLQYNLLDEESIQKLSDLFKDVKTQLLKLESEKLEVRELLNSVSLLETLLEINKKLRLTEVDFIEEIKALEEYEVQHLALWNERNKEAGFKFSINRIKWLKQILVQKSKKGDKHE